MFESEDAVLLMVDVQGKLARLMHETGGLVAHVAGMVKVARLLSIPTVATEQAPEKIGPTIPELTELFDNFQPIPKTSFSCCGEPRFLQALDALNRKQIIVTGIETHVCVYQTVCDLMDRQYEVQVVADAVSSRAETDKQFALERIRAKGGDVTTTEMIVCELMKTARHEKFREIINLIK